MAERARKASASISKRNFRSSTTTSPAVIEGYLEKKSSGIVKRWQQRWFSVAGHYLRYHESDGSPVAGALDLATLRRCSTAAARPRELLLETHDIAGSSSTALSLQAYDAEEAERWRAVFVQFIGAAGSVDSAPSTRSTSNSLGSDPYFFRSKSISSVVKRSGGSESPVDATGAGTGAVSGHDEGAHDAQGQRHASTTDDEFVE